MSRTNHENSQKSVTKPGVDKESKTSETVNLSAEELRRISGGAVTHSPPPKPNPGG